MCSALPDICADIYEWSSWPEFLSSKSDCNGESQPRCDVSTPSFDKRRRKYADKGDGARCM